MRIVAPTPKKSCVVRQNSPKKNFFLRSNFTPFMSKSLQMPHKHEKPSRPIQSINGNVCLYVCHRLTKMDALSWSSSNMRVLALLHPSLKGRCTSMCTSMNKKAVNPLFCLLPTRTRWHWPSWICMGSFYGTEFDLAYFQ